MQGAAEDGGVNIIKTAFDVKEQCQDLERWSLEGVDRVCESRASIKGRKRAEGARLVVVEDANISSHSGESGGDDPFQNREEVYRRTMIRNDDGESLEGFPSLSRTTPFAIFIQEAWWPKRSRGPRREVRITGAMWWRDFQTEYGMLSAQRAEEGEHFDSAAEISSALSAVQSPKGRRIEGSAREV